MADALIRSFRFKLKPTRAQHDRLRAAVEHCRQLYNSGLEERIGCYRKTGKGRTYFDQCKALTEYRADGSPYAAVMERTALKSLDDAYKAFFKRGGFPRFKGREWFKSIGWAERSGWNVKNSRFIAKGLGAIRIHQHRAIIGEMKSCRIKREGRHWYLSIACEIEAPAINDNDARIGIDLGLTSFAALSDGTLVPNPRHATKGQKELRRRQRALARCKRGSNRRKKVRERLATAQSAIRRARRTFHFQTASALTKRFGLIAIEDLNVKGLARGMLARPVNDAAWGQFTQILCDKAASAGCMVVKVDPRGTSQTCPDCGQIKAKTLSERVHRCDCGCVMDRDVAAGQVILNKAVVGLGFDKLPVAVV